MTAATPTTPLQRWEQALDGPLIAAAVTFLVAYALPILEPDLPGPALRACQVVVWVTWAAFAADLAVRIALAPERGRYFRRHLLDVVVIVLPLLRPLRLLRLVALLKVLNRRAAADLRGRVAVYIAGGSLLIGFCGALAVLDAERANPEANITSFSDAAWWALTTMTTVGYGDRYPTTGPGRLTAAALMVGGIALLGMVTATLASWLVDQVQIQEEQQTRDLASRLDQIQSQLDQVLAALPATARSPVTAPKPPESASSR